MLDLLVELIEELVGGGKKQPPPAQSHRRGRQSADASGRERQERPAHVWSEQPTTPVANQNPPEYEKMVREFFGIQEEETPQPAPAPEPVALMKEPVTTQLQGTLSKSRLAVPEEPERKKENRTTRTQQGDRSLREMVHGLRNNPDAARESFLYSEVFGPPLADRY